ncbi:MAG: queuosine precursor transporter [Holosporaceae bacterium]|jgi:uncharacterized integral membrane protein (TIGR00697 family)|nr:queuosine precursor transporter [Holosporaceae bacterium]
MADLLSLTTLMICFLTILTAVRFFGKSGLFAYSTVAVIISNVQVLKLTKYSMVDNPVALGTVVFSTLFAVDNILTEYYGTKTARKCVWMSFAYYLFFTSVMNVAVIHPIVAESNCVNLHQELKSIFSPCFVLFVSSLASYIVSQLVDIFVFSTLKKKMNGKYISLRSFVSMSFSTFVDNFVFSLLAWVIFAKNSISMTSLWETYIFTTFIIRLIVAALCVPLVKLCGAVILKKEKDNV